MMRPLRAAAEAIAILALVWLWTDLLMTWSALPATIPTHFGPSGQPDGWGNRSMALLVPCVAVVLYLIMTVVSQFPDTFNYPVTVTDENRPRLAAISIVMLALLKAELECSFAYLSWASLRVAIGRASGLGWALLAVMLITFGITLGTAIVQMRRAA